MTINDPPHALLFDVFGTCVDWRKTVVSTLTDQAHTALNDATRSLATSVRMRASDMTLEDWGNFAQQWRDSYKKFTRALAADTTIAWKSVDEHHHDALKQLLNDWKLTDLWGDEDVRKLSLVWHYLEPWPDTSNGILALNRLYYTATLSNGNITLLEDLRTFARMDFLRVFSAEMFDSYKPSPKVYLGAVKRLGLKPHECAMVAAHLNDLKAAKDCGLRTCYVERPGEEDLDQEKIESARAEGWVDVWVTGKEEGFLALAEKLGVEVVKSRRRSLSN